MPFFIFNNALIYIFLEEIELVRGDLEKINLVFWSKKIKQGNFIF